MKEQLVINNAQALLDKCIHNGIFTTDVTPDILDEDLLESGVMDSMSLNMLAELIKQEYQTEIELPLFIAELRTLNKIAAYLESH